MHAVFEGWEPWAGEIRAKQNGALVSDRKGIATPYAIHSLQDRGVFFIPPRTEVYEGMVIGQHNRQ